jgi:hypothetical protein
MPSAKRGRRASAAERLAPPIDELSKFVPIVGTIPKPVCAISPTSRSKRLIVRSWPRGQPLARPTSSRRDSRDIDAAGNSFIAFEQVVDSGLQGHWRFEDGCARKGGIIK